jgi:hypothetical protein
MQKLLFAGENIMDVGVVSFVMLVAFLSAMSALGIWLRFFGKGRSRVRRKVDQD